MLERWIVRFEKRGIRRNVAKIKRLLHKNRVRVAEKKYIKLLHDYKVFCTRAAYFEKLSAYHNILYIYNELKKRRYDEEKPKDVRPDLRDTVDKIVKKGKKRYVKIVEREIDGGIKEIIKKAEHAAKEGPKEAAMAKEEAKEARKAEPAKEIPVKETAEIITEEKPKQELKVPLPAPVKKTGFITALDELYDHVQQKGNVTITDASLKFKVGREKIEEWAKILEDHNLIKLYYPAFTSPLLMSHEWMRKQEEDRQRKKAMRKKKGEKKKDRK